MSNQRSKLKCVLAAVFLAAISEAVLWITCSRYGKMIDNDEWNTLGTFTFIFHIPGQLIRELVFPAYPESDVVGIPLIIASGAVQFFIAYWWLFRIAKCGLGNLTSDCNMGCKQGGLSFR